MRGADLGQPVWPDCVISIACGVGSSRRSLDQMLRIVTFMLLVVGLTACRAPEHIASARQRTDAQDRITDARPGSAASGRTLPHIFPREHGAEPSLEPITRNALSAEDASVLAARLANDQCERQYRRRPFSPQQYPIALSDGVYRWGSLDVGGHEGFSASVIFYPDGSEPHVEVYFSSDSLLGVK